MKGQLCWHFALLLYSIHFQCIVLGQLQAVPEVTARVYPDNTEAQREGDSVSLLCDVSRFNASLHIVAWIKVEPPVIISNGRDLYVGDDRFSLSFEESEISTFNLTISTVSLTDNGTYRCNLNEMEIGSTTFRPVGSAELDLFVYPIEAFPVCYPMDEETVTIGSNLTCHTNGEATLAMVGGNDGWKSFMSQNGQGAALTKNVTSLDNGKTYLCIVVTASQVNLSCNIGPLSVITVIPGDHQTTAETKTTSPTDTDSTLSAAAISGIVIGAIVLLLIIAVHTFCCRCNPRRWMHTKSYFFNRGSSFGTSHSQNNTIMMQSEVEMNSSHPERDDVPPPYSSVLAEQFETSSPDIGEERSRPVSKGESNVYAESQVQTHKPNLNIVLHLDLNIAVSNDQCERQVKKRPSIEESVARLANKAPDEIKGPRDTTKRNQSWKGIVSVPAESPTKPAPAPQIYTQVNKLRGNDATEYGDTYPIQADIAAKPKAEKKPKNIKKFVKTVADEDEAIAPQTIIYADLDMTRVGTDITDIKTSEDPPTIYAEIQHHASADPDSTAVDTN